MRVGISWMDVKLGLRMLIKHPGLTIVGGIGIAVGTAISAGSFAFFHSHLFPTLPLPEGDRIVAIENWNVQVNNEERQSLHDFVTWRDDLVTVTEVGAFRTLTRNLIVPGRVAESVRVAEITATGLHTAHVPPEKGRLLTEGDEREGAPPVVVIGHDVWQTKFSADPDVVGKDIRLGGVVHSIVGVMPAKFGFPLSDQFWTPLIVNPTAHRRGEGPEIYVFGRLAPGVSAEQAQVELTAVGQRASQAFPQTHEHLRPKVLPYTYPLIDIQDIGAPGAFLAVIQLTMSLALVVVCANVTVLVYARTAARHGEIAIRSALGASRRRIVGQLFIEALVLSSVAAAAGLALAQVGLRLGNQIMNQETGGAPFWASENLTPQTMMYAVGLTVLTAVFIGVLPALQATGRRLQSSLRELGGGTKARLGRTWTLLIVGQVAIAVAGLPAVAVMALNELSGAATRPTFASGEFLAAVASAEPLANSTADDAGSLPERSARFTAFRSGLMERLASEPAVAAATVSFTSPGRGPESRVEVEGMPVPPEPRTVRVGRVAANYFDALGAEVLAGRTFRSGDEQSHAVVVNRTFVTRILGGTAAVGRRIRYVRADAEPGPWLEIAGVVRDLHSNPLDPERDAAEVFSAMTPGVAPSGVLVVRIRGGEPVSFIPRLREIASSVDPTVRLNRLDRYDAMQQQERVAVLLVALIFSLVAAVVLLLSAAGIYALMSFTVTQRRREIGIRTALGADRRQVLGSIFARAAKQLALGVVVGAALVASLDPLMGGELLGGKAAILLPAMAIVMVLVGLLAAFGPARRALRIQPTSALRED